MSSCAHAGHREGLGRRLGQAERGKVGPLRDGARRVRMALGGAHDDDRLVPHVARAVGGADHHRRAAVALQRAVQQAQRIGDHARGLVILDGDRIAHRGVGVERGMAARRHGDLGELARGGAVEFHVPARHHRVELRRRDRTGRHLELADQAELRHLLHARADPAAGVAGAAERQQHMVADAGADRGDRALDRGDRAGASHRRRRRKAQVGNAEIGDEVLGHRAALAIRDHAIDVGRLEARILDRAQRRLKLEGQRRAIGAAHVLGLADAGDGSYFAQGHGCTPRTAATHMMGFAVALPILRTGRCRS